MRSKALIAALALTLSGGATLANPVDLAKTAATGAVAKAAADLTDKAKIAEYKETHPYVVVIKATEVQPSTACKVATIGHMLIPGANLLLASLVASQGSLDMFCIKAQDAADDAAQRVQHAFGGAVTQ